MVQSHPCTNLLKRLKSTSSVFARHNWMPEAGNVEWLFRPGMLFASKEKWWGSGGVRQSLHEGIDFHSFLDSQGNQRQLDATANIPVLFDGEIVALFDDFLGKTILVKHEQHRTDDNILFTMYGHVSPFSHVKPGLYISFGDLLGKIATPASKNSRIPAHLHLSVAFVPETINATMLSWEVISRPPVILYDPLDILEIEYRYNEIA